MQSDMKRNRKILLEKDISAFDNKNGMKKIMNNDIFWSNYGMKT